MPAINVRPFMRGGRVVKGYTAHRGLFGAKVVIRSGGGAMYSSGGFGVIARTPKAGRTDRVYVATKSSLARFDRMFNKSIRTQNAARRATASTRRGVRYELSSPGGVQ